MSKSFVRRNYERVRRNGFQYYWNTFWSLPGYLVKPNIFDAFGTKWAYRHLARYDHAIDEPAFVKPSAAVAAQYDNGVNPFPDKIWVLWDKGIDSAPEVVKASVDSIRRHRGSREVILLTSGNLGEYILLPDFVMEKYKKGTIIPAHFADILRYSLLALYGGIWIDATIFLSGPLPDWMEEAPMFFHRFAPSENLVDEYLGTTWFIKSDWKNLIMTGTSNVMIEYLRHEKHICTYLLLNLALTRVIRHNPRNQSLFDAMPVMFRDDCGMLRYCLDRQFDEKTYERICSLTPIHKLSYKLMSGQSRQDLEKPGTFYEMILSKSIKSQINDKTVSL
jgi:hypothetical protein